MPSLCNAPVVSLEMWPMIVRSCASGSGSSVGGEKTDEELGLV